MSAYISDLKLKVLGSGIALPGRPVSNDRLLDALGATCSEQIVRRARAIVHRLGINERYLSRDLDYAHSRLRDGCDAPSLCHAALSSALVAADLDITNIEYLVGHTTSPHTLLPPNIAWVAERLECTAPYLELRQACTGFANALQIASSMISANGFHCVAIVGSETGSAYFTANDEFAQIEQLVNYMQMGDGAGAVALGADDGSGRALISDMFIGHIGNGLEPGFSLSEGGSGEPYCEFGLPVFAHRADAVRRRGPRLFELGVEVALSRGYRLEDFAAIIPHQANGKMAKPLASHLGINESLIHVTADRFGNLGSAAIWLAFDDLRRSGKLARGDKVLILGAEATKFLYGGFIYTH